MKMSQLVSGASLGVIARCIGAGSRPNADYTAFLAKGAAHGFAGLTLQEESFDPAKFAETIEKLGTAFDAYKQANDSRLAEIEGKGAADPVTQDKLEKIEADISQLATLKADLDRMADRLARPQAGGGLAEVSPEAAAHKAAFLQFLRSPGDAQRIATLQTAEHTWLKSSGMLDHQAVLIGTPGAGGYAVPKEISEIIAQKIVDISPMRQLCDPITAGSSDYHALVDVGGEGYGWAGEGDTRTETTTSQLGDVEPSFGTIYAYPKASEESLMDIFFDVEAWVTRTSVRGISKGEGIAYTTGDGTKKPTGFLGGPAPVAIGDDASPARAFGTLEYIASGAATGFLPPSLSPLTSPGDVFVHTAAALKAGYRQRAAWQCSKASLAEVRTFKTVQGDYIWQPGLQLGNPQLLAGYPVTESEDMPAIGANAFPFAIGDWEEGYLIVDLGGGFRITRDEVTEPGFIKFYVRRRTGGKIWNDDAIKLLKIAVS